MKTLTLLRHAKSDQGEPGLRDYDRPLNAKGQRAAATMGRHWRGLGAGFDHVIASPAARVIATLDHFQRGFGALPTPAYDKRAYLASEIVLLELIRAADDAHDRLLVAGHNSGLEDLVLLLVPDSPPGTGDDRLRDDIEEKFPTASIAELRFDVARWADIGESGAKLTRFVRPRDLDSALGPDAN
ncbi:MAG: histidine phosphatase family protein [Pseudomonadota bacterium]